MSQHHGYCNIQKQFFGEKKHMKAENLLQNIFCIAEIEMETSNIDKPKALFVSYPLNFRPIVSKRILLFRIIK
jgi:hypothetical protein